LAQFSNGFEGKVMETAIQIAIGIVLGGIITISITIMVEWLRKPNLELIISPFKDVTYENRPARNVRWLSINLMNHPLPWFAKWMSRNAALQCHGLITFHHIDGQNIFGRSMPIRWSDSPEPVAINFILDDKHISIIDPARFTLESRMDIYPGESRNLGVAVKFDNEDDCYGWCNENYFSTPIWRNPNWKLTSGRYLIKVLVTSSGQKCTKIFRLINDVPQKDIRIEEAMPEDRVRD
jgi:hypothetical protein